MVDSMRFYGLKCTRYHEEEERNWDSELELGTQSVLRLRMRPCGVSTVNLFLQTAAGTKLVHTLNECGDHCDTDQVDPDPTLGCHPQCLARKIPSNYLND